MEEVIQPSEADLVARIANVLTPEEAPEEPQEANQESSEAEEPEASETEEPEQEEEGQAVDPDAPFIPTKFKTEGGEEREETLSINQLKSGYMMRQDYQRKTAELAKARDTLTSEVEQHVAQERNNYIQGLQIAEQALMAMVVPELNGVDMEQLAQTDPSKAVLLQAKAHKLSQTVNHIRQQIAQAQQQAMHKMAEQSLRVLSDPIQGIPGWNDQLYTSIITEGAKAFGFRPEEVANVVDHRMIRVLHDALQFQKAKAVKPKDQAKAVPKVLKPGTPQGKSETQAKQEAQLRQRLQKTGSVEDAAALYLATRRK
jgi:predicted transposase YbfD/YdcC